MNTAVMRGSDCKASRNMQLCIALLLTLLCSTYMRFGKYLRSVVCGVMLLSACSPHTIKWNPKPEIDQSSLEQSYTISSDQLPRESLIPWWYEFDRKKLHAMIEEAIANNLDIKQAMARFDASRAISTQSQSALFPMVDATVSSSQSWQGTRQSRGSALIGGDLSWEVDAFNRLGNIAKADTLEATARQEDVYSLKLLISAEVTNAYFGAVAAHQTIILLKKQVETDRDLLKLLELRLKNGVGTNVEVLQQQSRVAESESLIPVAESRLRVFENRLDVLLGTVVDGVGRVPESDDLEFTETMPSLGVPTDLLLMRPDLRAAQARLIAADADIGSAIADRLPKLTLTGSMLYSDTSGFSGPVSSIAGALIQPLLDWGKRKAKIVENRALYDEQLFAFSQLYLEALEDVENALYQENRQREFIERLEKRIKILKDTFEETEARYSEGVDDYLPVLNALQELRSVERNLVGQRLILINYRVLLHRALGGAVVSQGA